MERKEALTRVLFLTVKLFLAVVIVFFLYTLGQRAYQFGFRVFARKPFQSRPARTSPLSTRRVQAQGSSPRCLKTRDWYRTLTFFMYSYFFPKRGISFRREIMC